MVKRIGLDAEVGDRFKANSRKVKFCIRGPLPADDVFPAKFNDFEVVHHYLQVNRYHLIRKPNYFHIQINAFITLLLFVSFILF